MKKWKAIALITGLIAGTVSAETVIDAWHFDGVVDGSGLGDSSCASTGSVGGLIWPSRSVASIQNEMIKWEADGIGTQSYVTRNPSDPRADGATQGKFQLSYDVVSADFSNTAPLDLDVSFGYSIRADDLDKVDASGILQYKGSWRTNVVEGVTNAVNQNEILLVAADDFLEEAFVVTNFPGTTVSNLNIRTVMDFDNRGETNSFELYYTLNGGSEVLGYVGALDPEMNLGMYRQAAALVDMQAGDEINIDNIVLTMLIPPPPPPALFGIFEEWLFNTETNGTPLSGITNSAPAPYGAAQWTSTKPYIFVTNSVLRYEVGENKVYKEPITAPGLTNGEFQIEFTYADAEISKRWGTVGFGMVDGETDTEAFRVYLQYDGGLRLTTLVGSLKTTLTNFGVTAISDLSVRAVGDLDADTFDVFYTLGSGAEVEGAKDVAMAASGLLLDEVEMIATAGSNRFNPNDYVHVDNLRLSVPFEGSIPELLYSTWLLSNPTLVETNMTANPDGDALNNLYEYALGGDPMDGTDVGNKATFETLEDGGSFLEYVYAKRIDAAARGLVYHPETSSDLVVDSWVDANYTVLGTGVDAFGAGFDAVTNRISTEVESQQFIRLNIEFTP